MKLTCKQQDLARGLSTVSHAVSTRSTLPILSNILLAAENGRLRLSATNLEIGITCWVPANIQEEGSDHQPVAAADRFRQHAAADRGHAGVAADGPEPEGERPAQPGDD